MAPIVNKAKADFKIGYLQKAIIEHQAEVMGGTDAAFDGTTGYEVLSLVKLTRLADGTAVISPPEDITATSIGDSTHIVAQSDDSLRNVPGDAIPVEKYSTRARNILANTTNGILAPEGATATMKSIALYKITDPDDIRIFRVEEVI